MGEIPVSTIFFVVYFPNSKYSKPLQCAKESIDTSTPGGKFTLTVFTALAELERENILERQAEGISHRQSRGTHERQTTQGG